VVYSATDTQSFLFSSKEKFIMQGCLKPKIILPRISVVLLASALAIYLFSGLSSPSYAASKSKTNCGCGSPVGSWLIKATTITGPQPPSFQALTTYMVGGGIIETDQTDFTTQSLSSPAHGTWKSIGNNRFASTTLNFFFDAQGHPAGTVEVREIDTLSNNGNVYTGSAKFSVANNSGQQIANGSFTILATRIPVKPL
jgi:hypothetical protein